MPNLNFLMDLWRLYKLGEIFFQKLFNGIESTFVYIGDIIESIEDYVSRTFERIFRPVYITFKVPLENLGWAFRIVTNKILDLLCFSFDVLKTVVIFLFDVIYHLVWLVGFSSSFVVFKLPGELKGGFFTSLDLCNLAWSVTWDVVSQATNWTVWLVFFKLPELWEERCWQVIEVSISILTLLYALMREEWKSPLKILSVMWRLVMQLQILPSSQIHNYQRNTQLTLNWYEMKFHLIMFIPF